MKVVSDKYVHRTALWICKDNDAFKNVCQLSYILCGIANEDTDDRVCAGR